ncbi:hypothetical protein Emtol_3107 [Emticicia oligotrophica DSM 17448]|uniref:Periplasmic heavy metal sensor n=1 Tax=Emticicia oligotrophica (strain DSM 17448 / CIP 109782 / MTCC 6937 / GPTSA100-15) TaxID=929562 RepID=A0ABM5N451_EMTOG|nr:Spy/CpxP family protein refolding chaperone [Emticicia oligotrophica]AFK04240.1 hypothetical protein Emtol_3107 [Emticicia oligotrophica DSM 17448]
MKENSKFRLLWVAVGVLLLLNISLLAWISFFSKMLPREPQRLFLETELKFDEKQAEAYRKLRHEHAEQMRSLRDGVKEMKEAYYADLDKTISEDSLKERAEKIEGRMVEADVITFKHFQQVREMCTPEQQKHFDEVIIELIRSLERPGPPRRGPHPEGMPPERR